MSIRKTLVTGASSGIGQAICTKLLDEGYKVWGVARRKTLSHPHFTPLQYDLTDLKGIPSLIKSCGEIDTIICCAGRGYFGNLEELSFKDIHTSFDLNFLSCVYLIKTLLPTLKKKAYGDIIFIGSEAALAGKKRGSIYCATKFALRGFAQSLREECASSNVRVSMIQPGMVRTPFFDNHPFAPGEGASQAIEPEDIAKITSMIIEARVGTVIDEIIINPQKKVIRTNR